MYVKNLFFLGKPRAYKYHGTGRFIDDFCAINDEFFKSFKNIYPKELQLKVEHKITHVLFLTLTSQVIKDNFFIYKFLDKRHKFFLVIMPHLSIQTPIFIFYVSFYSELLQIAKAVLCFFPTLLQKSLDCTIEWSFREATLISYKITLKRLSKYITVLLNYSITFTELWNSILTKAPIYYYCYYSCTITIICIR